MKKYIQLTLGLFMLTAITQAQTIYPIVRNISTNPFNPYNTEWSSMFPNDPGSFINDRATGGFSWYFNDFPFFIDRTNINWTLPGGFNNSHPMLWPFDISNGQTYLINNPYTNIPSPEDDRDFHWEDGWELMYMNLGILPNGTPIFNKPAASWYAAIETPDPAEAPYFVLYNRYRGTLRVFFNVWMFERQYNEDFTLKLSFTRSSSINHKLSGAFRLASGLDQALDKPTEVIELVAPRHKRVGFSNWYVADFQMAYDVCQCFIPSMMELSFEITTELFDVDLETRQLSIQKDISKLGENDKNFFQTQMGEPGNVIYKNIGSLLEDYKTALDKYNQELNDYNNPLNQLKKQVIGMVGTAVGGGIATLIPTEAIRNYVVGNQLDLWGNKYPADTADAKKFAEDLKNSGKKLLADQFDFLNIILDVKKDKPTRPHVPVATFSEGVIKGTITSTQYVQTEGGWFAPGTVPTAHNNSTSNIRHHNFPAYNNVMGMFALMKTPELKVYNGNNQYDYETTGWEFIDLTAPYKLAWQLDWFGVVKASKQFRFMMNDHLLYAINPALDWDSEKTSFLVSFQIELEKENVPNSSTGILTADVESGSNFELLHHLIHDKGGHSTVTLVLGSDYYRIEELGNKLFSFNLASSVPTNFSIDLSTLGNSNWNEQPIESFSWLILEKVNELAPNLLTFDIKSIKMKVIADMYFDQFGYPTSDGEQVNTFQVRTFELYNKNKPGSIEEQLRGEIVEEYQSWANYIPGTTVLNSEIAHNDPRVKEVDATTNTIIIRAEHVEVTGPVKPAAGYNLRIEAMTDIKVLEGGKLLPNVVARIVPDFYGNGSNPPATNAEVETFCKGENPFYGANNAGKRAQEIIEANERERQLRAEKSKMAVTIYPNPTTNYVQVSVKNQPQGVANLQFALFDITGRQVFLTEQEASSQGQYTLQLPQLTGGVYMLHIKAGQQTSVEKVVIK